MTRRLRIRFATVDDVPLIRTLIRGLAEYERLANEAVVTEADLRASLFGERPAAEVLIAEAGDEAAGFALFFHNYSTFLGKRGLYLEDLFVFPAHRGLGIGRALMSRLAQLAVERSCGRFEWWVLDWNESAIHFYETLGARAMSDWTVYRLSGEPLARLAREGGG
ncbi:MAG TPA: GNAT family N-acetyltransferase [Gemmatimonadaceae bacterium]|nr:GNAT family N-acetyltransferase [Gemmatimonadaceae bacterium]